MRTVLTTLCVGDEFRAFWDRCCAGNWSLYAARHGYALEVLHEPIDTSPRAQARSPAWQKCLVLCHPRLGAYDRVVWIDADIVITPHAPPIAAAVPPGRLGAVVSGDYLQREMKGVFVQRMRGMPAPPVDADAAWVADQRSCYIKAGIECSSHDVVQTGVLVLEPSHRAALEAVYARDLAPGVPAYEQFPLSAEILNRGLLHRLDSRFNLVFVERAVVHYPYLFQENIPQYRDLAHFAVMTEHANAYFLHFAYNRGFAQYLNPNVL